MIFGRIRIIVVSMIIIILKYICFFNCQFLQESRLRSEDPPFPDSKLLAPRGGQKSADYFIIIIITQFHLNGKEPL